MNFIVIIYVASMLILAEGVDFELVVDSKGRDVDVGQECGPKSKPCVVKCCAPDKAMYIFQSKMECKKLSEFNIDLSGLREELRTYSGLSISTANNTSSKSINDFRILYRKHENFKVNVDVYEFDNNTANMTEDGNLHSINNPVVGAPLFCYEMIVGLSKGTNGTTINAYRFYVVVRSKSEDIDMFVAYGGLISVFFMMLVLLVYALFRTLRTTLYARMFMIFIASLMTLMLINSFTTIYEYRLKAEGRESDKLQVCSWLTPIGYFLVLSTFFWMNAVCFDIWWTFRYERNAYNLSAWLPTFFESDEMLLTNQIVRNTRSKRLKALGLYALYAWGCPAVIAIAAVIIDNSNSTLSKPGFNSCMHDTEDKWKRLYKYLPMTVMVLANIVLFSLTSYNIWLVKKHSMTAHENTRDNKNKNQFLVYLKLSVIMGVTWITELIQAVVTVDPPPWLFYVLNVPNVFCGVLIFFSMVFKWSIFVMLCKRCGIENKWTRQSTHMKTRSGLSSKASKTEPRSKFADDSIVFESINCSRDATAEPKVSDTML